MQVSVVIAAYNEERFIREAVESIVSQTGVAHEVIVVDDQSTDRTPEILRELSGLHSNLRVVSNPRKGKVAAFNLGIELAVGDWVAIFAGDDIMPEDSLQARLSFVADEDDAEPVIGLSRLKISSSHRRMDGVEVPRRPGRGAYSGSCFLMNRPAVKLFWPIPEIFPNEDTWLEIGARHLPVKVIHTPVIGCIWRMHENNSINLDLTWSEFDDRYSKRMSALIVFYKQNESRLSVESGIELQQRILCESYRRDGNLIKILLTKLPLQERLRAVAYSSKFCYFVRQKAIALLSGFS